MRKTLKIILAVFLALAIFAAVGFSVVFLDVASYTATSSQLLVGPPIMARALVVYDPGLTGAPKAFADDVAARLQDDYNVELAGIRSPAATANVSQYAIIVVGGPIYAGNPSASVKSYLGSLKPASEAIVGVFGVGSFNIPNEKVAPSASANTLPIREEVKINTGGNFTSEADNFAEALLLQPTLSPPP